MPQRSRAPFIIAGVLLGSCLQLVISGRALHATTTPQRTPTLQPLPAVVQTANAPAPIILFSQLVPPADEAPTAEWLNFAHQVKETRTDTRHDNNDYTTPLLSWYVYIARHHPDAIYEFYASRNINDRLFSHLLQFGLLPDWYEKLPNASQLLLKDSTALINLATHRGIDFARGELITAIRGKQGERFSIEGDHLLFAMSAMDSYEIEQLFSRIQQGAIVVDPRDLRALGFVPELAGKERELLAAIAAQGTRGYSQRAMSSYFLHAAELGGTSYVEQMLPDAQDNAAQPTNFYCAACYLALVSDGLIGSTLIDHVNKHDRLYVTPRRNDDPFFPHVTEPEYLLSLEARGGAQ